VSDRSEMTTGEAEAFRAGVEWMRRRALFICAGASQTQLGAGHAGTMIALEPVPDPRSEPAGLEYRDG